MASRQTSCPVAVPLSLVWAALGVWLGLAQRRRAEQPR